MSGIEFLIDPHAGVCPGVRKALRMAERELDGQRSLVALGSLIHNERAMERLENEGLQIVPQTESEESIAKELQDQRVLIRSHGISPQLYFALEKCALEILDGTCGTVKKVQKLVRSYFERGYQILIVGKPNHPEVKGLLGHCENAGFVGNCRQDFTAIQTGRRTVILAQTTFDPALFYKIAEEIRIIIPDLVIEDTTCRFIVSRQKQVGAFAQSVDVLLLVGGRASSNTGVLYDWCRSANPKSYWIENETEIKIQWLTGVGRIGITGSASTPLWQLNNVKTFLEKLAPKGSS